MKKIISTILTLTLLFALAVPAVAADEQYRAISIPINGRNGTFELKLNSAYLRNTDVYMIDYWEDIYETDPQTGNAVPTTVNLPIFFLKPGSTVDCPDEISYEMFEPDAEVRGDAAYFMNTASGYEWLKGYPAEKLFTEEVFGEYFNYSLMRISAYDPKTDDWEFVCYLAMGDGPLAASAPAAPTTVGNFADVKSTDYYADAVTWAINKGITSGTSATTFSPNETCSTAQIITFLWRANGSPAPSNANPFSDLSEDQYYTKAAIWAHEKGLVSGTTFGANTPCTRSNVVTYLWKLAGNPTAGASSFSDVPAGADYAQAVAWAVNKGVTSGTSGTTFSPGDICTRGQIVTFLHRDLAK